MVCKICSADKTEDEFYQSGRIRKTGAISRQPVCKKCNYARQLAREKLDPDLMLRRRRKYDRVNEKAKVDRRSGEKRSQFIVEDCLKSDRKRKMGNDLTVEFVEGILSSCSYCGETEKIQLSIDRIDNKRGHLQDNVVPACVRCNIVRRDMPYEAWLMLAPAMK